MLVQLVVVFSIIWLLIREWKRRHIEKLYRQLKISAPRLPFIGHLYLLICNKTELIRRLQRLGREAIKAGGITGFWMNQKLYINIADPKVADIVLKKCLEKDDLMKCFHILLGNSSVFSAVKLWRPRRRILQPTFSMTNLNKFVNIFSKQSEVLVEKLQNKSEADPISMWKMYSSYNMDSVSESLGAPKNGRNQFLVAIEEGMKAVTNRIINPWLHSDFVFKLLPQNQTLLKTYIPFVYGYIYKIIQEKQEQNRDVHVELKNDDRPTSFIDLMLESGNLSNLAIGEESIAIITAASETTAISLEFISRMMAKYPKMQEKVYNEVKEVIGDVYRPILKEDLPHLKYLEAFIQESLRLYPAAPMIVRKIDKIIEISSGITLLPDCGALINIWAINRNPTYWGKDAEEFRPERFLDSDSRPPCAFATFSLGPRNCIGFQYAMMSMKTVLATVLQQYRLVPASESIKNEPLVEFDIMMRHLDHYCVGFEARK